MKHILNLSILLLFLSSCSVTRDFNAAKSINSIKSYENYLRDYPDKKYSAEAEQILHNLYIERDWKSAVSDNSIESFEDFLSENPESRYVDDAKSKIKSLIELNDWNIASESKDIELIELFQKTYPESRYQIRAELLIRQIEEKNAWFSADEIGTIESYENFINNYPEGSYKKAATSKIYELKFIEPEWKRASKQNTYSAYKAFYDEYGQSRYGDEAKRKYEILDNAFWEKAKARNTIDSYGTYIDNCPDGDYYDEAQKLIIDLEVDEIFKGNYGNMPSMNKVSDARYSETVTELEIFNNTIYTLTVRYSGNNSYRRVIPPKQRHNFKVENGKYRVAASVNAKDVQNYAGNETFSGGGYEVQYYIVTERR